MESAARENLLKPNKKNINIMQNLKAGFNKINQIEIN